MTPEEQQVAIEAAEMAICCSGRCQRSGSKGQCIKAAWHDEAETVLAPMFAKIAALEAENATLRKRLGGERRNAMEEVVNIADTRAARYDTLRKKELSVGENHSAFESEYARDICKSFAKAIRALANKDDADE